MFAVWSTAGNLVNTATRNLDQDVVLVRQRASDFLSGVETDLRFLAESYQIKELGRQLAERGAPRYGSVSSLEAELLDFERTKQIYYRIRILDANGLDILRVQSTSGKFGIGGFAVTPRGKLSRTSEYYYVFLTRMLKKNQTAFSPAEVPNEKLGRVAVISFATPLYFHDKRVGILVADVFASTFFQVMASASPRSYSSRVMLVSGDGHFLYDSQKRRDWKKLFITTGESIDNDYSRSVSAKLLSGTAGIITKGIGEVVSYAPLFSKNTAPNSGDEKAGFSIPLFVIETIPKAVLMRPAYFVSFAFGAAILGVLVLSVTLSLVATSQFTRPIEELSRGAEIISGGNYEHRLKIETRDEIENLADQFNAMADSILVRDRELMDHKVSLEKEVTERTAELREQKSKLQTILDNVPSALLVLDRDLTIQSVSAALGKVTGYQPEEVIGKVCCDFFCKAGFCQKCVSRGVVLSGKSEGHLDRIVGPDGTDRFIEHFSVPMQKDGEVEAVLEIVTDVTSRKKLEQHLLKTEKLATMGELAAFIAHEFRNSLTSIKMILQLFNESDDLDRSKKESLTVALNSAYRMETTVSELLGFARPTKMDFRLSSVNHVVEESIAFVKLRAEKSRVTIENNPDVTIPDLMVDVVHLREALVNIVFNAVQAIEERNISPQSLPALIRQNSSITIVTRRTKIGKTLRDFMYVEMTETSPDDHTDLEEIVLKKGTECVQIEIADTGPGITKTNISRIFDPFFTTKPNGTGLGLSMAKRVVNGHGGIVVVESKPGVGTRFRILLPLVHPTVSVGVA